MLTLIRQIMLLFAIVPAAVYYDLLAVTIARTGVAIVTFVLIMVVATRLLEIRPIQMWRSLLRPGLAGTAMVAVVLLVQAISPEFPPARLALSILTGLVVYPSALILLWRMAGRPDSVEADLLSLAKPLLAVLRRFRIQKMQMLK
jgi:hypothetical protein